MKKTAPVLLVLLCGTTLSCGGRSPSAPPAPVAESTLQVFVAWNGQGVADRRLEIVELGLVQVTDATGNSVFRIPPGTYTLRAFVDRPGPPVATNIRVTLGPAETQRVVVPDCLYCK